MNATWITLAVVTITGITKLLTWLLGRPRKIAQIKERITKLEDKLRIALEHNDSLAISTISLELDRLRQALHDLN